MADKSTPLKKMVVERRWHSPQVREHGGRSPRAHRRWLLELRRNQTGNTVV